MACKINIEQSKTKYMNISIPNSLDDTLEKAIKSSEKARMRHFVKWPSSIAGVLLIFVLGVNVSPVFAAYVSKIPGISQLVDEVRFDKGLEKAAEEGFVQQIGNSDEDKGIKLTIDSVIVDRSRLVMNYTIETMNDYDDLDAEEIRITSVDGKDLETCIGMYITPDDKFKDNRKKSSTIDVMEPETGFPDKMIIKCLNFRAKKEGDFKEVKGEWVINIKLDKRLMEVKPKEFTVNKAVSLNDLNFTIDSMKVYPTSAEVKMMVDKNSKYIYMNFINPHLEDEKGNKYGVIPMYQKIISSNELVLNFESNYFVKHEKLFFKADGVYFVLKENDELVLDLENKKVIKDGGFNIEYANDKENVAVRDKKYDFQINYVIKDEDIKREAATHGFAEGVCFDYKLYDENNNVYEYVKGGYSCTGEIKDIEGTFNIIKMDKKPQILRVKITGASKGIYKPISIRIK